MPKFSCFCDLVAAGYVRNRTTLQRWMSLGIFPPPADLGPNTIAWADSDLAEYDARVRAGIATPHEEWLARLDNRRAGKAA